MPLAVVTCRPLPEPDPDQEPLLRALSSRGVQAELVPWDDPQADWSRYTACVLRSTWDYHRRPQAFAAWVEQTAAATRLLNPAPRVLWNMHKAYLLELAGAGIPVAPTVLLRRHSPARLEQVLAARGWREVVIKPAVSAGSFATVRVRPGQLETGEAHLRELLAREDALVQEYLPAVEGHGERALVAIQGQLSHAVRKSPRLAGDVESVAPAAIEPAERALAEAILARFPGLLYARVDLAPGPGGDPCLMELELIEPSLFLLQHPPALERLANALASLAQAPE